MSGGFQREARPDSWRRLAPAVKHDETLDLTGAGLLRARAIVLVVDVLPDFPGSTLFLLLALPTA